MTSKIGKILGAYITPVKSGKAAGSGVVSTYAYKTSSYASIPYERAPQVMDTVPTKGLLPGYATPEHVWIA